MKDAARLISVLLSGMMQMYRPLNLSGSVTLSRVDD